MIREYCNKAKVSVVVYLVCPVSINPLWSAAIWRDTDLFPREAQENYCVLKSNG